MITIIPPPPRVKARLKAVPAIRELYWCDFPQDAQSPEFWKCRPVVIVSFKNTLSGAVTVIPCSSQPQPGNPWAYKLTTTIDGDDSWAICDKPTTVAVSRLSLDRTGKRRLPEAEFNGVLALLLKWLPVLPPPVAPPPPVP
jgi:mRNA interferase MazF